MRDLQAYYSTLEVSETAEQTQIKESYRRLAKKFHPDGVGQSADPSKIRDLNEAYDVLGDPTKRAQYDRECLEPDANQSRTQRLDPLRCHVCGKIAAQPRYLVFWRVFSLIIVTSRSPIQGLFCAGCAKREAMRSTLITAFVGWWGVPWGPIWTIGNGFTNANGGQGDETKDEALIWYNALAFLQSGQVPLAFALAERLIEAKDVEIQQAASDLVAGCKAKGVISAGHLKDPWHEVRAQAPVRFGALLVVPAAVTLLIAASGTSNSVPNYAYSPATHSDSAPVGFDSSLATPSPDSSMVDAAPVPQCSHALRNGHIISGRRHLSSKGHTIEISNGSAGDAIVKIRDSYSNELYASYFVRQNETADLEGISDGTYNVQYALGHNLMANCKQFVLPESLGQFPDNVSLIAEHIDDYRGTGTMYQKLTYTLYSVPGGNVRPQSLSPSEFDAE